MTGTRTATDRAPRWLMRIGVSAKPRARLVCLPYAGAGTVAYRTWPSLLPAWLEVWAVLLPGRETRINDPPVTNVGSLVGILAAAMVEEIPDEPELPYALYGHSMGAAVGFELSHAMLAAGWEPPLHLFASGRRGPQIPDGLPSIHRLPSAEFMERIKQLNGLPEEIISEPGLVEFIAHNVAADFAVIETYQYVSRAPLPCGISAFGGDRDPTTEVSQLWTWRPHATGPFSVRVLPGDHFFINSQRDALLAAITEDLAAALTDQSLPSSHATRTGVFHGKYRQLAAAASARGR
jgi:medium-chain acyl-[acyl-carrier-protein] hydrolase